MTNEQLVVLLSKYSALIELIIEDLEEAIPAECWQERKNLLGVSIRSAPILYKINRFHRQLQSDIDNLISEQE